MDKSNKLIKRLPAFWITLVLMLSANAWAQQFGIQKNVLDAAGGVSGSANFRAVNAVGQPMPVGISQNSGFINSAGFLANGGGSATAERAIRVVDASASPGATVTIPIQLVAQGDENALGFSLSFDSAVLSNPQAVLGEDAGSAFLNTNGSQVTAGRFGIALSLTTGAVFPAGTLEIVVVSFDVDASASVTSTAIDFVDQPVAREVVDANANTLSTVFAPGTVSLLLGLEADVAPRPNGNGKLSIADWVQVGRFAAGLDQPRTDVNEFQRADCAPIETLGNGGKIGISDWVQAGKYVAGVDPPTPAGGPTGSSFAMVAGNNGIQGAASQIQSASGQRLVRALGETIQRGETDEVRLAVQLEAEGDENALGFSLNFDPSLLTFNQVSVGSGLTGATLISNTGQTDSGRLGIALALPFGQALAAGTQEIVVVTFKLNTDACSDFIEIDFGDQPVGREVVDVAANTLSVDWQPGTVIVENPVPAITSPSPESATVNGPAFTLTVDGERFVCNSVVRWNGSDRVTTFVSTTQLTAEILASDLVSAGTASVTVFNPEPGGGSSNAQDFTIEPEAVFAISPTSESFPASGGTGTINVTAPSGFQWSAVSNEVWITITSGANGTGNGAVNYTVAANTSVNSRNGEINIAGESFTVSQAGQSAERTIRVVDVETSAGASVSIPIQLVALGDENALGFSLAFDPSVLSNPQATLGQGAGPATLKTNDCQVASGHFGITLCLTTGAVFPTGTLEIVVVTFEVASNASVASTEIGFVDQPTVRKVVDANANILSTVFAPGRVSILLGLEADIAPRNNCNNTVSIADWVQVGRFAAGLDQARTDINEFQRADCAPKSTLGNAAITISDWVQAGRYAAGLDPATPAGGPSGQSLAKGGGKNNNQDASSSRHSAGDQRLVRAPGETIQRGETDEVRLTVQLEAQGDENALGFSLNYDPNLLTFDQVSVGSGLTGATLIPNTSQSGSGRVGIALALPFGQALAAGTHEIVVVTFKLNTDNCLDSTQIDFGDQPVGREVVDVAANALSVDWQPGTVIVENPIPAITSLSPDSARTNGPAFTLAVHGKSFACNSVVRWNGSDRVTTFVSETQLTAEITAEDIRRADPVSVTVFNPEPGGGSSSAQDFTIIFSTAVESSADEAPISFGLGQNYPNPFNPSTTIEYALPRTSHVTLKIYSILGEEVATLVDEKLQAGRYKAHWIANGLPSGTYFYRLQVGDVVKTMRLTLMK